MPQHECGRGEVQMVLSTTISRSLEGRRNRSLERSRDSQRSLLGQD